MSVSRRAFVLGSLGSLGSLSAVGSGVVGADPAWATVAAALHHEVIGHSRRGQAINAYRLGRDDAPSRFLVVGQMHGDELGGWHVVRKYLLQMAPLAGVQLWIVPTVNPDGRAAGTRTNARGVDLNRNFDTSDWKRQGGGTAYWSGPRPGSEPETRAMQRFLTTLHPYTMVSMHQPLAVVDFSGGDPAVTRWLSRHIGLPARRIGAAGGNMTTFLNENWPRHTGVTLELPRPAAEHFQHRTARVLRSLAAHRAS
jgi:murein peptide amidase A